MGIHLLEKTQSECIWRREASEVFGNPISRGKPRGAFGKVLWRKNGVIVPCFAIGYFFLPLPMAEGGRRGTGAFAADHPWNERGRIRWSVLFDGQGPGGSGQKEAGVATAGISRLGTRACLISCIWDDHSGSLWETRKDNNFTHYFSPPSGCSKTLQTTH